MDGPDKLRLLERAVTASTNSIVITDPNLPEDPLVYVNPAFEEMTAALLPFYEAKGLLRRVDGVGKPDEVTARIYAVLQPSEAARS